MKKQIFKAAIISLFLLSLNACGSETNLQPLTDNTVTTTSDQVQTNSIFQPERKIIKIVADIFNKYDHNMNGQIDYRYTNTLYNDYFKSNESNNYGTSTFQVGGGKPFIRVYSRNSLFTASDTDNNGFITQDEMIKFIKDKFDTNNDDILSSRGIAFWQDKDEYQLFNDKFGEVFLKNMTV